MCRMHMRQRPPRRDLKSMKVQRRHVAAACLAIGLGVIAFLLLRPAGTSHSKDLRAFGAPTPPVPAPPSEAFRQQASCRIVTTDDRGRHAADELRSLTIVHTTVVRSAELMVHAAVLELSAPSWLVTGAIVLAVNGPRQNTTAEREEATRLLLAYPQRHRQICYLPNNGYYLSLIHI